mmetsp:Transcript_7627/g.13823  ORF Transcript_7627/g.13823 Transcript_7627/m.13823 type:complete len:273 (-) Transcript_7627:1495-2313(-)
MSKKFGTALLTSPFRYVQLEIGTWLRETGLAMDRLGMKFQGNHAFRDRLNRHRQIMPLAFNRPIIGDNVFISPDAHLAGLVNVGNSVSIFYKAALRAQDSSIVIGNGTNIQDHVLIVSGKNQDELPGDVLVGDKVTIGHMAVLKPGVRVGNCAMIGIKAVLESNAIVETRAVVAANALVESGVCVPEGELWAGAPARMMRKLTDEELAGLDESAENYMKLGKIHMEANGMTQDQIFTIQNREALIADRVAYQEPGDSTTASLLPASTQTITA